MTISFLLKNIRSLIYALIVSMSLVFIQELAATSSLRTVGLATLVVEFVLVIELYSTYAYSVRLLRQLDLPTVEIYSRNVQLVYHLLLPTLTFLGFVGFVFTNNQLSLSLFYFLGSFVVFSLLFINIRAYYQDKFKLEKETHVVYDILKIVIFFTLINSILNFSSIMGFNFFVLAGMAFCLASLLTMLVLVRVSNLNNINLLLVLLSGLATGYVVGALDIFLRGNSLLTSLYATLIFYIFNAILHHEISRTLKVGTVLEYILVALICFLVVTLL